MHLFRGYGKKNISRVLCRESGRKSRDILQKSGPISVLKRSVFGFFTQAQAWFNGVAMPENTSSKALEISCGLRSLSACYLPLPRPFDASTGL